MKDWIIALLAGGVTGVLSAWGVGGGSLLILFMTGVQGMDQPLSQGINLLYFLPTSLTALVSHLKNRLIDIKLALCAVAAGAVTTALSSLLATGLDTQVVRKIFGAFVVIIGITELFRKCPETRRPDEGTQDTTRE
ncbi:MAG: sulfite exporter TauE/SafE family protein [Clostridiales bacterium]|nr:sulfite exporter TauE/SafE family protein [Clostridiales bacterium]